MAKSFHLRWNNHLTNLQQLMEYLYNEQSFVDVTLSCSDGLIRAHKLVLSACSPYFDTIFKENPCKHPTVILKGIGLREMQSIIEYMYVGSVDVFEENLSALLEAANELHVKGLVQVSATASEDGQDEMAEQQDASLGPSVANIQPPKVVPKLPVNTMITKPIGPPATNHRALSNTATNQMMQTGMYNNLPVKMEEGEYIGHCDDEEQENMTLGYVVPPGEEIGSPETFCQLCNRQFLTKQNMKRHMQTHTGEKPHKCDYCELSFLRLSHLQRHHRVHTGERPFNCDSCEKNFARSDKLKQHVIQHHSGLVVPGRQYKARGRPRKPDTPIGCSDANNAPMEGVMHNAESEQNAMNNLHSTMQLMQQQQQQMHQMQNYKVALPVTQ